MAQKKNIPLPQNPLASMDLDDFLREETSSKSKKNNPRSQIDKQSLIDNLEQYTGVKEQGVAIWLPKEVKKRLELARAKCDKNIPLRSLASAIIMTYIDDVESVISEL